MQFQGTDSFEGVTGTATKKVPQQTAVHNNSTTSTQRHSWQRHATQSTGPVWWTAARAIGEGDQNHRLNVWRSLHIACLWVCVGVRACGCVSVWVCGVNEGASGYAKALYWKETHSKIWHAHPSFPTVMHAHPHPHPCPHTHTRTHTPGHRNDLLPSRRR